MRRYLEDDAFKLYQLIWQRFVASQMVPAVFDQTTIDVAAGDYTFRAIRDRWRNSRDIWRRTAPAKKICEKEDDDTEAEGKRLPRVTEKKFYGWPPWSRWMAPRRRLRCAPTSILPNRRRDTRKRRW